VFANFNIMLAKKGKIFNIIVNISKRKVTNECRWLVREIQLSKLRYYIYNYI